MFKSNFFKIFFKIIVTNVKDIVLSILNVFYPEYCPGCDNILLLKEKHICTSCLMDLPYTNFKNPKDNELYERFYGRIINLEKAFALCYFVKHSQLQNILHALKYKNMPHLGYLLGCLLGDELNNIEFNDFDLIIPVPLHKAKLIKRGYNQSEKIAQGIAEVLNKKVDTTSVKRVVYTETQTKKKKLERLKNVENIYTVEKPENLENKHILIVDDVITTGATLASLAETIEKQVKNIKISIASVAIAKK